MGRKSPHALQSCPQSKMLSITSRAACTSWHTLHACIATQSQRRRFSHKTRSAHSLATEAAQQQSLQRSSQWQEAHSRTAAHPTYPGGCCGATCQLPHQKLPLRRVLYFSLEEWEGGGSKTRQVTLARHSHTHRGGRSRRERGCSQERSPQRPFRCTCVNSRWEKAGERGGGKRCDESRFEQLRRCFPTPHLSRGQHGTGKYRRLLFHDTFAHYYNLAHNGERLFAGRNCGGEGE